MSLTLLDWRRRVHALYAEVRAESDPAAGARDLAGRPRRPVRRATPQSPLLPEDRAGFTGCAVAPYDPRCASSSRCRHRREPPRLRGRRRHRRRRAVRAARRASHLPDVGDARRVAARRRTAAACSCPVKDAAGRRPAGPTAAGATCSTRSRAPTSAATPARALVVDLNFAYNPSCAYDPAWACPLAPPGNTLPGPVRAGELYRGRLAGERAVGGEDQAERDLALLQRGLGQRAARVQRLEAGRTSCRTSSRDRAGRTDAAGTPAGRRARVAAAALGARSRTASSAPYLSANGLGDRERVLVGGLGRLAERSGPTLSPSVVERGDGGVDVAAGLRRRRPCRSAFLLRNSVRVAAYSGTT